MMLCVAVLARCRTLVSHFLSARVEWNAGENGEIRHI